MNDEALKKSIHDIKGALAALNGFIRYLENNSNTEEAKEVAQAAKRSVQRIISFVEQIEEA